MSHWSMALVIIFFRSVFPCPDSMAARLNRITIIFWQPSIRVPVLVFKAKQGGLQSHQQRTCRFQRTSGSALIRFIICIAAHALLSCDHIMNIMNIMHFMNVSIIIVIITTTTITIIISNIVIIRILLEKDLVWQSRANRKGVGGG